MFGQIFETISENGRTTLSILTWFGHLLAELVQNMKLLKILLAAKKHIKIRGEVPVHSGVGRWSAEIG